MANVLEFIKRRFPTDCNWTNGNCYYFALILSNSSNGTIYYDVIEGHFNYDYFGVVNTDGRVLVEWDKFEQYDALQQQVVQRDVIN